MSRTLNIDLNRIHSIVNIAKQRDGNFHILAGGQANLWVAGNMMEKVRELLQADGEVFILIDDDFDLHNIDNSPPGTLYFFREIRKQEANGHSASVVEQCLNAGGTVFAVVHGMTSERVIGRLVTLGLSQSLLDARLKIESIVSDVRE